MDSDEPAEYNGKIIVIGDPTVGKTCLIHRFCSEEFNKDYIHTIGVDFMVKKTQIDENTVVVLSIWDICGQDRYRAVTRSLYKSAVACVVVASAIEPSTLEGAVKWKRDLDEKTSYNGNTLPSILIINKVDLLEEGEEDQFHLTDEELEEFCAAHKFNKYFFTSAKEYINVDESFRELEQYVLNASSPEIESSDDDDLVNLDDDGPDFSNKNGCKVC